REASPSARTSPAIPTRASANESAARRPVIVGRALVAVAEPEVQDGRPREDAVFGMVREADLETAQALRVVEEADLDALHLAGDVHDAELCAADPPRVVAGAADLEAGVLLERERRRADLEAGRLLARGDGRDLGETLEVARRRAERADLEHAAEPVAGEARAADLREAV